MIYLDYAANTPVDPQVLDIYCRTEADFPGNPNAKHEAGRLANHKLNTATEEIAALLGVKPTEVIYTASASESNNMALKGLARSYRHKGKHIISTCLEHSSVSGALTFLQDQGYEIDLVDILPSGAVDLAHLKELLREDTIIVSVSWVDGELGAIQPIGEIGRLLSAYPNCHFHVDATQAIGKIPIRLENIDLLTFTPHKFYGLNGCGVLIKKENTVIEPLIHGGVSTTLYRSGTPALALAVATNEALKLAITQLTGRSQTVHLLHTALTAQLKAYPLVRFNSPATAVPHILNISVSGVKGERFQSALDQHGVCVSTKSACAVPNTPSRPVYAITRDKKNAMHSWRISLSHLTLEKELHEFIKIFDSCYKELTK